MSDLRARALRLQAVEKFVPAWLEILRNAGVRNDDELADFLGENSKTVIGNAWNDASPGPARLLAQRYLEETFPWVEQAQTLLQNEAWRTNEAKALASSLDVIYRRRVLLLQAGVTIKSPVIQGIRAGVDEFGRGLGTFTLVLVAFAILILATQFKGK